MKYKPKYLHQICSIFSSEDCKFDKKIVPYSISQPAMDISAKVLDVSSHNIYGEVLDAFE